MGRGRTRGAARKTASAAGANRAVGNRAGARTHRAARSVTPSKRPNSDTSGLGKRTAKRSASSPHGSPA